GLLRRVEGAHRPVPADLRRQGPGKSNRTVRRAEGQPSISPGRADPLRPDRADREAAGAAGLGEGRSKTQEAEIAGGRLDRAGRGGRHQLRCTTSGRSFGKPDPRAPAGRRFSSASLLSERGAARYAVRRGKTY